MSEQNNGARNAVVIYHANCMDGFAAAWAFHLTKEPEYKRVEYIPCKYGEVNHHHQELIGWDVYIVDFSFPREELTRISAFAYKVVLLDHHKTAQEDLTNWPNQPKNLEIVFDMNRSGAGITWDWCVYHCVRKLDVTRPTLIDYVEDRDLWKFKLWHSKEINAVIANTDKNFLTYSETDWDITNRFEETKNTGIALNTQFERLCNDFVELARPCSIATESTTFHGLVANVPGQFSSEVGGKLAIKSGTFGATYYTDSAGDTRWSLRSRGSVDVSEIARTYGGGGHKAAAGFVIPGNTEVDHMVHLWKL